MVETAIATRMETPVVEVGEPLTPMAMIERAVQSGQSVEVIERLMALQERWDTTQARKAFDRAIADAKAEIPAIQKKRKVDFTTSKGRTNYDYEDMATIADTVGPILTRHGLSYRYRTEQGDGGMITVTCIVSHRDGHSEETSLSAGRDESGNKNNIQAVGSTATYLQRYTLKLALGLAVTADDDGKAAGQSGPIKTDQIKALRDLIDDTGTDIEKFCAFMGVEALTEIQSSDFQRGYDMLIAKQRKGQSNG